jgi:hypothetical protein
MYQGTFYVELVLKKNDNSIEVSNNVAVINLFQRHETQNQTFPTAFYVVPNTKLNKSTFKTSGENIWK